MKAVTSVILLALTAQGVSWPAKEWEGSSMAILSKRGVSAGMKFACCECSAVFTGEQILRGETLYIVRVMRTNPSASIFRCECCQEEWEERQFD